VIGTDEACGEARQIVSVLPVQLTVGNIHTHKMPQNPTLGDRPSEFLEPPNIRDGR
jgi:hypothetical protein